MLPRTFFIAASVLLCACVFNSAGLSGSAEDASIDRPKAVDGVSDRQAQTDAGGDAGLDLRDLSLDLYVRPDSSIDALLDSAGLDKGTVCTAWDPSWSKRSKLTFDNAFSTAGLSDELSGFPVLVKLTQQRLQGLSLRPDGADLRFVDADDKILLAHEVELWDPAGDSFIWVRVPKVDKSSSQDFIWIYHGNQAAGPATGPGGVWSNGFRAVWHLTDDPTAAAPQFRDATSNSNHGSNVGGLAAASLVTGQIGRAVTFSGALGQYVEVPDSASLDVTQTITLEGWVKPASINQNANRYLVNKRNAYFIHLFRSYTTFPAFYVNLAGEGWFACNTQVTPKAAWTYLVGTYDVNERIERIYIDGTLVNSTDLTSNVSAGVTISNTAETLRIGRSVQGPVDEVRVSAVKRSDGWIAAQHRSMTDAFVTFGSAQLTCP
jgi:hypothetical protein